MACVRHWWLGDCAGTLARDDMAEPIDIAGERHGLYQGLGSPPRPSDLVKVRGLLPEYGLAHWFDGATRYVQIDSFGITGPPFTITLLMRPAAEGLGRDQCLVHMGVGSAYVGIDEDDHVVFGRNGAAPACVSNDPVLAGHEYLVVASHNGSTGTLYVRETTVGLETDIDGPASLSFSSPPGLGDIGSNFGDVFTGAMQGVAILNEALNSTAVTQLIATTLWIDVTDDVEIASPIVLDQGMHDDGPLARVSATGRLTLLMDNSHLNSGGVLGYYSGPTSATNRPGFTDGIPIRVAFPFSSETAPPTTTSLLASSSLPASSSEEAGAEFEGPPSTSAGGFNIQFIGTIRHLRPDAGVYRERRTAILATDWMDEAARARIEGSETQTDLTADELLRILIDGMRNRPHAIDFQTGSDTIPYAFHNIDEKAKVLSEVQKVTLTEYGLTTLKWDGTLKFETRGARGTTYVDYIIEDALDIEQERATDQKKNLVAVTVHPASVGDDPDSVLYGFNIGATPPDTPLTIPNGPNEEIFFAFNDPGQQDVQIGAVEVQEPVPTTDYVLSVSPTGGAAVTLDPSIELVWRIASNGIYLSIVNGYGQPIYMTFLQVKGRPVYTQNDVTLIESDPESIADYGAQEIVLDMPYQADSGVGTALAQYLLSTFGNVTTRVRRCSFFAGHSEDHYNATLNGSISDRVRIRENVSGIDADYFIQGRRVEWRGQYALPDGSDGDHIDTTWFVQPTSEGNIGTGDFWNLEIDQLDETTVLGF